MQNWKLSLTYDGTAFHGWQVQPGLITIQGELQAALQRVLGTRWVAPLPQGSGRTDAGVHALGQIASFVLEVPIPAENLARALNRTLPAAIRVLSAEPVAESFHARHSAQAKTYEYRIFRGRLCPPFLAPYVHTCIWKLDMHLLQDAARAVIGEHDFTSLAASEPDSTSRDEDQPRSNIRTIFSSSWSSATLHTCFSFSSSSCSSSQAQQNQNVDSPSDFVDRLLIYRVRGSGFLHHMVRNLVGTQLEIARGQFPVGSMPLILAAQSRSAAGPTAPASGLFLHSVEYSAEFMKTSF